MSSARRAAFFVGLSLIPRLWLFAVGTIGDESAHLLGSWELLRGGRLYADFGDNKPPLVYAWYALAQVLCGRGIGGVRALTFALLLPATAWALSAFWGHGRRGLWAGGLFLVYSLAFLPEDALAVNTELLLLAPAALAFLAVRNEEGAARPARAFTFGLGIALATLLKPTAALWLLSPVLLLRPLAVLAGFAVPLGVTAGLFAAHGTLADLVQWTLLQNVAYASTPMAGAEGATRAATRLLPWLAATAPLWWGAWRAALPRYERRLLFTALVMVVPSAIAGGRFYGHYFVPWLVPLCLAAAPWAEERVRRPLIAHAGLVASGFTIVAAVLLLGRSPRYEETSPLFARVAARLQADPCARGATLFVWGYAPEFYVAAEVPPATRYVLPAAPVTSFVPGNRGATDARREPDPQAWDVLLGDLERRRATFVVDTAPIGFHHWDREPMARYPRLASYVATHYDRADTVDGIPIWRRRGCPAPAP